MEQQQRQINSLRQFILNNGAMSGDNEANPMLRLQMAAQIQVHNLEEFCQVDCSLRYQYALYNIVYICTTPCKRDILQSTGLK